MAHDLGAALASLHEARQTFARVRWEGVARPFLAAIVIQGANRGGATAGRVPKGSV
jgi:hypothetical protein